MDPREGLSQSPGRIQKLAPIEGSIIYTIGILESSIGGFCFLDPSRALGYSRGYDLIPCRAL